MNIFILDQDIRLCAQAHYDKHVVKMILESAQLLSTAQHQLGSTSEGLYKQSHVNHPCAVWARQSYQNYNWLYELFIELILEYIYRYDRQHACLRLVKPLAIQDDTFRFPQEGLTPFAQCVPEQYRQEDPVAAYRQYYTIDKRGLMSYKRREAPQWL
jgi:hypothetical protein